MSKVDNETEPRFAVGIDLGTTNSVLSCVDLAASDGEDVLLSVQAIPQLTGPGAVEERKQLPSFIYLPHSEELAAGDLTLPWSDQNHFAVGELARAPGTRTCSVTPLITSAGQPHDATIVSPSPSPRCQSVTTMSNEPSASRNRPSAQLLAVVTR